MLSYTMRLTTLLLMATAGTAVLVMMVIQSVSGQAACGDIGGVRGELIARGADNFYINAAAPAGCSGYVNSFSFCYYRPSALTSNIQYVFTFALYRKSNGGYKNVSRTLIVERILADIQSELGNNSFGCVSLPVSKPIPVEAGDVLGACVYDPPGDGVGELDIVSLVGRDEGNLLRAYPSVCSPNTVPSSVIPPQRITTRVLNLQAEIVHLTQQQPTPPTGTTTISETTPQVTDTTPMNVPTTITTNSMVTVVPAPGTTAETETTPRKSETTTMNGLATTVLIATTESSTNITDILTDSTVTFGVIVGSVIAVSIIIVMSAAIVLFAVLLVKKHKSTQRDHSIPTPGHTIELDSNTAYGVSREMNSRQFEDEVCYETIDSYDPVNTAITRAPLAGGVVVTNLQRNEAYGVGQSVQGGDDNEYWNVIEQDNSVEYDYI